MLYVEVCNTFFGNAYVLIKLFKGFVIYKMRTIFADLYTFSLKRNWFVIIFVLFRTFVLKASKIEVFGGSEMTKQQYLILEF